MTWYVEDGIGEERAILLERGEIVAARMNWPGTLAAGQVEDARLVSRAADSARGTGRFASGEQALVDGLPREASEGTKLRLKVTRAAIAEAGRVKLARARPTEDTPRPAPSLAETLGEEGHQAKVVLRFPVDGWDEIVADAVARAIEFDGGALHLSPPPALTLIDIAGALPPPLLALAALTAIAAALERLDNAGSLRNEIPPQEDKTDR